ncbi:MAG: hypothetical protein FI725_05840 [SAR202 cluster bacterium]|nr:hypothetical protein [SAR202 cluster bacterium]|tara:strand:- start:247 stop:507 length:261 start_codon:yes stop_codon:yes gene_type:complete
MNWWYRLYGWSHLGKYAPIRVLLISAPAYWVGQLTPIIWKRMEQSLTGPQDIFAGFWLGFTFVLIFLTLLTLPSGRYHELKEKGEL